MPWGWTVRAGCLLLLVAAAFLVGSAVPSRTAPAADDIDAASPVGVLPFVDTVDVSTATTAPDDPECFGRGYSVWYRLQSSVGQRVALSTAGSGYDTTLSVYRGERGALRTLACDDDSHGLHSRLEINLTPGVVYWIMVAACCDQPSRQLRFEVAPVPTPPTVRVWASPHAQLSADEDYATVRGTFWCSTTVSIQTEVRMAEHKELPSAPDARAYVEGTCGPQLAWEAHVPTAGRWDGGSEHQLAFTTLACDPKGSCYLQEDRAVVSVRP